MPLQSSFPLTSFLLHVPNTKIWIITLVASKLLKSIYLFSLFPPCFPFCNKDHKGCKSKMISWSRFFQHTPQWGPILPYTMLKSSAIKLSKEGRIIGTWIKPGIQKPSTPWFPSSVKSYIHICAPHYWWISFCMSHAKSWLFLSIYLVTKMYFVQIHS